MITKEQIQHIATLARLDMQHEEVAKYQEDLSEILNYFDILKEVDTNGVEPMTHSMSLESVSRNDVPQREHADVVSAMMRLAPTLKDGFLKVKAIFSFR